MTEFASPSPYVKAWRDGIAGHVMLDRPQRRNALNRDMWAALPALVAALDAAPETRVLVVSGAGSEAFAAGADIGEFAAARTDPGQAKDYEELSGRAFAALRNTAKPVIAMIQGFCIGGGLALALAADLRIAARTAVFSLPPARLGLAYPVEGLRDLLHAVSPAFAKEMLFTARRFTADEALHAGLVHRVVATDRLADEVAGLCAGIGGNAPLTITASKRAIDSLAGRPVPDDPARLAALCFASADYAEGRRAFLEKRRPRFTGT
ncbi:MAG: enoyl-CoA hydratase-related protein [Parvibaculaceae bacterium]